MKITYDPEVDAAYISLVKDKNNRRSSRQCVCADQAGTPLEGVVLDVDDFGKLLGIEILDASRALDPELLGESAGPGTQ